MQQEKLERGKIFGGERAREVMVRKEEVEGKVRGACGQKGGN